MTNPFLQGKTALVTGGSKGIGFAIAEQLLHAGAAVVICGRDPSALDHAVSQLSPQGHIRAVPCDVSDPQAVEAMIAALDAAGGFDILINNAGVGIFKSVEQLTIEDWKKVIDINLNGIFYCSHFAIPVLKKRGGGPIINIGSLAGKNPFAGGAAYNASKFGLNGFSEAMMLDHRHDGIRVTAILPGSVDTNFSNRTASAPWKPQPDDIAQIVLDVLRMPSRTLISRVEVRPAMPPK